MLEVVEVSKYYGALAAVREVSFAARPGEVLGYLGPNGSGKSTTVNMVAGLLEPSDGEIRVDGENIQRDILAHRRRIASTGCRRCCASRRSRGCSRSSRGRTTRSRSPASWWRR